MTTEIPIAIPRTWRRSKIERNLKICRMYACGKFTTEFIARKHTMSRRQVQLIAKAGGVVRTQADANRVAAPLKNQHRSR